VTIEGLPSLEIRDQLAAGQLDLGFTAFPFRREGLSATHSELLDGAGIGSDAVSSVCPRKARNDDVSGRIP
jgi:hypothetical protein